MRPSYRNWEVVLKNFSDHIYMFIISVYLVFIYLLLCCIYIDVTRFIYNNKVEVEALGNEACIVI